MHTNFTCRKTRTSETKKRISSQLQINYLQHPSKPMNPSLNQRFSQLPPIHRPLDLGLLQGRHRLVVILVHLVVGLEVQVAHVLLLDREG